MAKSAFDSVYCKKDSLSGLEKIINLIKTFILSASFSVNGILYGKATQKEQTQNGIQPESVRKSKKKNPIEKALEKGLIEVLKDLSSVDFCNILNYLANSIGGSGFNPRERPAGGFALAVWNIQNEAYKLQIRIDRDLGEITGALSADSTLRLTDLIIFASNTIRNKISNSISESQIQFQLNQQGGISDPKIEKYFKRLFYLQLGLDTSAEILESIGSNITVGRAQKAVKAINKIRSTLILIQGLNNPAAILSLGNQLSGGAIQEEIARINRLIPLESLVKFLKWCLKLCANINSVGQKVLGSIKTIQFFVKILTTVIKVFTVIRRFFLIGFQLPNAFTTVSVTNTASNIVEELLNQKGIKKLIERLDQINSTLCVIVNFVNALLLAINEIIPILRAILLNIESCKNIDDSLKEELSNVIDDLTNTRDSLQGFINSVSETSNQVTRSFGKYTIDIITEEVVDEAINLRRRYGIARGLNGIIVVQSTPTFASLDLIIINEVKALLISKGLVNVGSIGLSSEDLAVVSESISYLGEESITIDTLDSLAIETPEPVTTAEDEDSEDLQLGEFIDNLPGGRKLRKRVRNKLIKNNETLIKNLKETDPSSSGTQKIIQQKEAETNKLKIEKLEDQKKDLKKLLLITPGAAFIILGKIKKIDNQIKALKNNQK